MAHMIMLWDYYNFDMIDNLLNAGRHIDEKDNLSEGWNLMGYILNDTSNDKMLSMKGIGNEIYNKEKRIAAIKYLFLKGFDPHITFEGGDTLFHLASLSDNGINIIKILLENNVDPLKKNDNGE